MSLGARLFHTWDRQDSAGADRSYGTHGTYASFCADRLCTRPSVQISALILTRPGGSPAAARPNAGRDRVPAIRCGRTQARLYTKGSIGPPG